MNPVKKRIRYSDHLQYRLRFREINDRLPKMVYRSAKEHFLDIATNTRVAVAKVTYKGRLRDMAVTYREDANEILLITIHPLKLNQKENRIQTNRWRKI